MYTKIATQIITSATTSSNNAAAQTAVGSFVMITVPQKYTTIRAGFCVIVVECKFVDKLSTFGSNV